MGEGGTENTSGRPAKRSAREIEAIRTDLIDRKRQLAATMGKLSGDAVNNNPRELGEISSLPSHLADLGTETFEQDKDLGLAERASAEIGEIDDALERLKAGDYGICEACEQPIHPERLKALPHATLCAACKTKQEAA
jgi:RNA polymerase-binding transcription factor DksA